MDIKKSVNIKICCIKSINEALMAIDAGITTIGLVGPMPSGPGIIDLKTISEIVHNWDISRRIVEEVDVPIYLAGGLNSLNVQKAVRTVQPYGVDLCSGVRINDRLNKKKLEEFIRAVNYN